MNRREFFKRAALIAAGVVAADQLELLERLAHKKVWAGHRFDDFSRFKVEKSFALGFVISHEMIEDDIPFYTAFNRQLAVGYAKEIDQQIYLRYDRP